MYIEKLIRFKQNHVIHFEQLKLMGVLTHHPTLFPQLLYNRFRRLQTTKRITHLTCVLRGRRIPNPLIL